VDKFFNFFSKTLTQKDRLCYAGDTDDKSGRKNIEKISYFNSLCVINNQEYNAVITVRKIKNYGDKYYHHYLEDIKIEPCSGITRPAGGTG
jgi:hypothetical protein